MEQCAKHRLRGVENYTGVTQLDTKWRHLSMSGILIGIIGSSLGRGTVTLPTAAALPARDHWSIAARMSTLS
jgi:hypothetical protein